MKSMLAIVGALILLGGCQRGKAEKAAPTTTTGGELRKPSVEFDVSGQLAEHVTLDGLQGGKLAPIGARLMLSQANQESIGSVGRRGFTLQSKDYMSAGQAVRGYGRLEWGSRSFEGADRCTITVTKEGEPEGAARERWVEGVFSCRGLESTDHTRVDVANGRFLVKLPDDRLH